MKHDDYKFESTQGIKLKLPPVSNLDATGLDVPILKYPPSPGEMRKAKKRMEGYFQQTKTMKNPNLLSEMLRKEFDGHSVAFVDELPEECNFPIYVFNRSNGKLGLLKDINNVRVFYPIDNPDLYWTPMIIGD